MYWLEARGRIKQSCDLGSLREQMQTGSITTAVGASQEGRRTPSQKHAWRRQQDAGYAKNGCRAGGWLQSTCLDAKVSTARPARGRNARTRASQGPCSQPAGQANLTSLGYGAEHHGDSVGCLARLGTRAYPVVSPKPSVSRGISATAAMFARAPAQGSQVGCSGAHGNTGKSRAGTCHEHLTYLPK